MSKLDYYNVLGVPRGASGPEIKKAFRKKAKELHPDQNKDTPNAEAKFKEVNEAYDILKDPRKKEMYDRFGHDAFQGGNGAALQVREHSLTFFRIFSGISWTPEAEPRNVPIEDLISNMNFPYHLRKPIPE